MLKIHPFMKALAVALALTGTAQAADLQTAPAQAAALQGRTGFDGVVEAVRQTVVAAQTPGAVVELNVKAGDHVKAGQLLLRIDARAADQSAAASDAQVLAARAALVLDENNTVLYAERVAEITEEPNYGDALAVLG